MVLKLNNLFFLYNFVKSLFVLQNFTIVPLFRAIVKFYNFVVNSKTPNIGYFLCCNSQTPNSDFFKAVLHRPQI